jgi:Protein of unknown function (DUF3489)
MPKLSDTALVILSNAAKRDERLVLPLPKSVKGGIKGATPILKTLVKQKLVAELNAMGKMPVWREDKDNRFTLVVTDAGLEAIGIESNEVAQPEKTPKRATAGKPKKSRTPTASSGTSKLDMLKEMLQRKEGMTVAEASKATGWLMHSVRGVMSGVFKKKQSLKIDSEKVEGRGRVYRLAR